MLACHSPCPVSLRLNVNFAVRVAVNIGLVLVASWLLGREEGGLDRGAAVFFVMLLSLITALHDRFWPVHEVRAAAAPAPASAT